MPWREDPGSEDNSPVKDQGGSGGFSPPDPPSAA